MIYRMIGLGLFVFVFGLVGCLDEVGPAWHEDDQKWSDIEDVGGREDASDNTSDVDNTSSDSGTGGDASKDGDAANEDTDPPEQALGRSWVLGTTWEDRPIVAEEFGTRGPIMYIMSGIHGNEQPAVTFGERLRVPLQGGLAERAGVRVFYLGAANPDGIASDTRYNSSMIDLNRNFPSDNFEPTGWGGDEPLSERESVVIHDSVVALDPAAVISIHCCVGLIDWDGPGESLASRMATAAGFPADRIGSLPGSFGSFAGTDLQIPTITVEFDRHDSVDTGEQLDKMEEAIVVAMDWVVEEELEVQNFSIYEGLSPKPSDIYSAFELGRSAGNLSIRGERIGEVTETRKVLIVAGIDASDRNTLYVAEHIRNRLLSEQWSVRAQTTVVTAVNPDGIFTQSSRNARDEDVAVDFGSVSATTPEAVALRELIASGDFKIVIFVDADANGDRIESFGWPAEKVEQAVNGLLDVVDGNVDNLAEGSFVRYLSEQNVPVIRFAVTTKFAVGKSYDGHVFEDITVFSEAARRLVE